MHDGKQNIFKCDSPDVSFSNKSGDSTIVSLGVESYFADDDVCSVVDYRW